MSTPEIKTGRLLLRSYEQSDYDAFCEYYTDPSVRPFLGGHPDFSENAVKSFFRGLCEAPLTWAAEYNGKVIGEVYITDIVSMYLANIGYLFNKRFWGQGLACEAVRAVLACAFTDIGLERIRAAVLEKNIRSVNLVERCGFSFEALLREADYGGRIGDVLYYSITQKEYNGGRYNEV